VRLADVADVELGAESYSSLLRFQGVEGVGFGVLALPTANALEIQRGVTDEMAIAREETFGPVVPVSTIRSEEEAVQIVNGSPYGLLSAVFTRDLRRGLRYAEAVRAGWVNVNEGTNYWESHLPFGGAAGSASGVGRVGGRFSMERLTELKTVVVSLE